MTRFDRTYDVSNNVKGQSQPIRRPNNRPAHLIYDEVRGTWVDPNPDEHHVSAGMDIVSEAEAAQEAELTQEPAVVTPEHGVEPETVTEDDTAIVEAAEEAQAEELAETPEVVSEDPVEPVEEPAEVPVDDTVGGNPDAV